jgi:hypothetical protein
MSLQKMDPDTKMEIIINMAWGTPLKVIAQKYKTTESKIVNLRKNNYKLYNQISEGFYIVDEVAILGLCPIHERAVNVIKNKYKARFKILDKNNYLLDGSSILMDKIIELADSIIALDDIPPLSESKWLRNFYKECKK